MKKLINNILLLIVIILAINSTGCKQKPEETEVVSKLPKPTLTICVNFYGVDLLSLQNIEKLNAKSNVYKLEILNIPTQNYNDMLNSLILTNSAPDLIMLSDYFLFMMKHEAFLDITEQVAKDKNLKIGNYYKSAIDAITNDKKLYGIPFSCSPFVLFYNQDIFEDSEVPLPTNDWKWEDFRKAAKKLTKDTNGDGKIDQWGLQSIMPIEQLLQSYNVNVINENSITSTQAIDAFNMLSSIVKDKSSQTAQQLQDYYKEFNEEPFKLGKAAMTFRVVPDHYKDYAESIDNLRIAEMPYGTVKNTIFYEKTLSINAKTKYKEAAYRALVDLIQLLKNGDFIPPIKDGLDIATYNRLNKSFNMSVIKNSLGYGVVEETYYDDKNTIMKIIYNNVITPIIDGTKSVADALNDAVKLIKAIRSN